MMRSLLLPALFAASALATEAIYLANGIISEDAGQCGNTYDMSEMAYYNDISQSSNGQYPQDTAFISCGYQTWEGQTITGTFSSGTTFTVNLAADARYYSVGQYAGYGQNSYGTGFDCFRDNDRTLYGADGNDWQSIYYCKQV